MAASQEQLNQLQGLYIAYFGRPNDAAGIEYWGAEIDSGVSFDEIANRFMESDEFTASSSDLNDVVRAAYTNALGRDAGDEEVAYWVGRLEAGDVSVAGLLEAFRSTDDATDSATLENKITVANAYTEAAVSGAGFDVAASKTALASVDETPESVAAALEEVGAEVPGEVVTPTEGLNTYVEAAEAEEAALEALARAAADLEEDATEADVSAAMTFAATQTRDQLLSAARADVTSEEKQIQGATAALASARAVESDAELSAAVTAAQREVNNDSAARTAQTALQEAESEVAAHVAANGSDEAVAAALYEAVVAFGQAGGNVSSFSSFVSAYQAELLVEADDQDFALVLDPIAESGGLVTVNPTTGQATLNPTLTGATAALRTAVSDAAKVAGVRDQLNDVVVSAENAFASAGTPVVTTPATSAEQSINLAGVNFASDGALSVDVGTGATSVTVANLTTAQEVADAINATTGLENTATVSGDVVTVTSPTPGAASVVTLVGELTSGTALTPSAVVPGSDAITVTPTPGQVLLDAQQAVVDRQDLVDAVADEQTDLADAQADLVELTALVSTYFDAREATAEALEALAEDYGIEGLVEVANSSNVGVANTDELFLFSQSDDFNSAVISFEAGDQLYVGDKFAFGGTDATAGDNSALEVFFVQRGGNVEVRLEESAFGSNAATPEVDVITLVGVNAGQLSFNDGFISVVETA